MTAAVEIAIRVIAAAVWATFAIAALRGRVPGRILAATAALALALTVRTGVIAEAVDVVTGRVAVATLLSDLLLLAATALVVDARPRRRRPRRARAGSIVAAAAAVVMCGAWAVGAAPGPATVAPEGLSASLLARPGIAVAVLVFGLAVVVPAVAFLADGRAEVGDLAPGRRRRDLVVVLVLGGGVVGWAAGVAAVAGVALVAQPWPATRTVVDGVLAMLVAAGLAAAVRAVTRRDAETPEQLRDDVLDLHRWLLDRTRGTAPGDATDDLFVAVVEIRDRIWTLQRWVRPEEADAAVRLGRELGLGAAQARAFALAVCLEIAVAGVAADDEEEVDVADLSALGGAATEQAEVAWLAQVQRARVTHGTAAAARDLLTELSTGDASFGSAGRRHM
ncbi:hypothetical protein PSU4_30830 [Pseudonocardia sulfidoxydans NBRC 16205]|uniref:DUF6545 domain-containing protein n=1 Tax=Pseudonocardia sulfidoxydans NBRC 16205 TaxID=1223511 RepID=A0A511DH57_9PSEU|nr:DUF6545 domain-containing protein [Pseudonocardia sulfidoxydans]GEL24129.1 hypothetical protein PSU4_30830 [Pseudonocardia sulfidoxydans NBRC 16205]